MSLEVGSDKEEGVVSRRVLRVTGEDAVGSSDAERFLEDAEVVDSMECDLCRLRASTEGRRGGWEGAEEVDEFCMAKSGGCVFAFNDTALLFSTIQWHPHPLTLCTTHTHSTQGQGISFLPTIIYNRPLSSFYPLFSSKIRHESPSRGPIHPSKVLPCPAALALGSSGFHSDLILTWAPPVRTPLPTLIRLPHHLLSQTLSKRSVFSGHRVPSGPMYT